ncbi:SDR family oxidoreductase [Oceanitalea stevensii]|uniref:SDR family oxidoreductase n=1 Tax=Oceanitalea stevensii TaxID=2763072 RepID=A0ABR8Z3D2_9MICO|nr:SDR family oxidoreductase [Oceanitalea stevensii]MBD8062309.1 SDR family oxidoreductase [Oceanitalea stevensii]
MDIDTNAMKDFPEQSQPWPGWTNRLDPVPDHGETSYVGRGRLEGKRALITGGDSGIGRATAIAFAKEGADVAISYLEQEQEDAEETKKHVEAAGRRCVLIPTDQRTEEANIALARAAVEGLGGIDVLVNNAGYQMAQDSLADISDEQLRQTFETNIFAIFWLTKALLDDLKPGASVINCTSIQAFQPSETLLDYASTKAAINNLTVNLAAELGPKGIRVNAVAPGPVWTPLQPATKPAESMPEFGKNAPLGRAGHPIEVATAFVFLATDDASYVSGTVLGVTGGKPVF